MEQWQSVASAVNMPGFDPGEAEIARLSIDHRYFTAALGGLLPRAIPMHAVRHVLDVGSGPGDWALDLIKQYPSLQVTGIDNSEKVAREAERRSHYYNMRSAKFVLADATRQLPFNDDSFDLVHMRFASSFIFPNQWPTVLAEMLRVLRPGGWINIVEQEPGSTSYEAFNRIMALTMQALRLVGLSLSPFSNTIGVAARIYGLLLDAYLLDVSYDVHIVDLGADNHLNNSDARASAWTMLMNFKPLVIGVGLVDAQTWDALLTELREEVDQAGACGYSYLISTSGRKDA